MGRSFAESICCAVDGYAIEAGMQVLAISKAKRKTKAAENGNPKEKTEGNDCMQITSSYGVEIKKQNIPIRHTLRIYRSAVSYLIQVYAESWEELSQLDNIQKRFNAAEHLVHETKKNRAKYDFDLRFSQAAFLSEKICDSACTGQCFFLRNEAWFMGTRKADRKAKAGL